MNSYKHKLFVLALGLLITFNYRTQIVQIEIKHLPPLAKKHFGLNYLIPNFTGMNLEGKKPFLEKNIDVSVIEQTVSSYKLLQKTILSKEEINYFNSNGIQVPNSMIPFKQYLF